MKTTTVPDSKQLFEKASISDMQSLIHEMKLKYQYFRFELKDGFIVTDLPATAICDGGVVCGQSEIMYGTKKYICY